jgi:hypothetical protein
VTGDRVARVVAASSLAVALVALGIAGYAMSLADQAQRDAEALGASLAEFLEARTSLPMQRPPPELDDDAL